MSDVWWLLLDAWQANALLEIILRGLLDFNN
jgi:hypothetical protein